MSQAVFLTAEEFLDLALAELPQGVFAADRADSTDTAKRSVSSSELRAAAQMFAQTSNNLSAVYNDKFLSTLTASGIAAWEANFFETPPTGFVDLASRVQNLTAKIRSTGGISFPAIKSVVSGILGDIPFDLLPYSGQAGGAWLLGVSELGFDSWLAEMDPILSARTEAGLIPLDCSLNGAAEGLSTGQVAAIQRTAYTYSINIYANASAQTLMILDQRLTEVEPARSTHVIFNNQTAATGDFTRYIAATPNFARMRL